ncbi:hypothetical protein CHS0354_008065 [Potamilus streckersoni]|uniref:receptor protein-tyrosine kinase n=1 Tax=Potamilus streckersoni TaxID=2493646 RepID=A0AAE0VR87_9BIVA|nr:hypothetical protein CHS0354_008065 [Potamilus streckersoni]
MKLKELFLTVLLGFINRTKAVEIIDTKVSTLEKECYGTNMGFSISGGPEFHYESIRRRYKDCTYVQGNLEITNLNSGNMTYDLSFLATIRVVTGYVLLGLLQVETIPLTSLRLIRADNTMTLKGEEYGLIVALTSEGSDGKQSVGLRELHLPVLSEITRGKVYFGQNPLLCHVDTIAWDAIVSGKENPVTFAKDAFSKDCPHCPMVCTDKNGIPRCWGAKEHLCQQVRTPECHTICPGRCFESGLLGCCHPECAIGCYGPFVTDCFMCKYFRSFDKCVSKCPENTYPLGQDCIEF